MDRRTKYTKKIIKDTLIDLLLDDKDITKVTVSEICQIADINRATFYRYYLDIFDLLDKMEEDFVDEFKSSYENYNYENKNLIKVLFSTKNNIYFLNDVLNDAYIRCKEKWEHDLPEISVETEEFATAFIFNGTLGVVNYWIQNDFDKSIEELADIITNLSYYGTEKFIYNK